MKGIRVSAGKSATMLAGLRAAKLIVPVAGVLGIAMGYVPARASAEPTNSPAALVNDILNMAQEDYPGLPAETSFRKIVDVIAHIDRARFVPERERAIANRDSPLPIGFGQTISDPYIVAIMSAAVGARPGSNILEVGTGSGYQAAVLSGLGASVHSVEIVPQLARAASKRLHRLGYEHVWIRSGDGFAGWPEFAPYDAIIVSAGAAAVPAPLLDQLRSGGKLVMPVGTNTIVEQLIVVTKQADGSFSRCSLGPTMFVPLTGVGETPDVPGLYDRTVPLCRNRQTARWPGQPVG